MMPFWGSSSQEEYKKKLEHKMCVAKETPEPIFDLAECNLVKVPDGVFSMCRVFLKEILLLHGNQLHSLQGGGSLRDLSHLKTLNLSYNRFCSLPEDIGRLANLEVLNLEGNKLKDLPSSLDMLRKLWSLNVKSNKLKEVPMVLCNLRSLRYLNLCDNIKVKTLPNKFSDLLCLEHLELDVDNIIYPSPVISSEGPQSIIKFLYEEQGKIYDPSLAYLDRRDNILDQQSTPTENSWIDASPSESYLQYQRIKEQRQLELVQMEEAMKEDQELQASIAAQSSVRRQKLIEDVAQEQERLEDEILLIQSRKDKERQILLAALSNIEDHSAKLIDQLMCLSEKNKHQNLLETWDLDRMEAEEICIVKQEELEEVRKRDILDAMKEMLQAEERQRHYQAGKLALARKLQNSDSESDLRLLDVLCGREQDQQMLFKKLQEEEAFQKEAFEALQLQKDKSHSEISYQIKLIEEELSKLTMAELKKKDLRVNIELSIVVENRVALAQLLSNLLQAKEVREMELQKRLNQMEQQRLGEMKDFWFIQYQKLLDRKPAELINADLDMDNMVRSVVIDAGASDFLTLFSKKAVTWPQLLAMTIKDLKRIGIINESICKAILNKAKEHFLSRRHSIAPGGTTSVYVPDEESVPASAPASTPVEEGGASGWSPTAPPLSPDIEMRLFCQAECVVCLDHQSSAGFLPCGHVCCCWNCSAALVCCPMCRMNIDSKFSITFD